MYLDIDDISKGDVLILDRKAILPIINHLKCKKFKDLKSEALNHILGLESEVIPLYSVSKEKCKRYNDVLDHIVNAFLSGYALDQQREILSKSANQKTLGGVP